MESRNEYYTKSFTVSIINHVVLVVVLDVMTGTFLLFFQFLVNNMVACGRRFWWIWENENYEDELQQRIPIAFLQFNMVWTILNGSLTAEFCGSEVVLMNILNSFVKLRSNV